MYFKDSIIHSGNLSTKIAVPTDSFKMYLIQSIDKKTVVIAPNPHHFSFYFYLHTSLLLNMFLSSKFLNMFLCSVIDVYTYSVVFCFNAILFHYIYRYLLFFCVNVFYFFFIIVFIMQRHMVGSTFDRKIPFSVSSICILFDFFCLSSLIYLLYVYKG